LSRIDSVAASAEAKRLSGTPSKGKLNYIIKKLANPVDGNKLLTDFEATPMGQKKFNMINDVFEFMSNTTSNDLFKRAVDDVMQLQKDIPEAFREQATEQLNNALREIQKDKAAAGLKEQADYIESKLPKPKGF